MRLGQIKKLLDARPQTHPEPFAAAERDQRMRQLIALSVRVCPGIEESGEALQTVGRDPDQQPQRDRQQHAQAHQESPVETAEEQDAEGDGDDHDASAEIWLVQQQRADRDHHRKQRQEAAHQRLLERLLRVQERRSPNRVARRIEDDEELHELRRLHVDQAERQPALAAIDRAAYSGNEDGDQQHRAGDKKIRGERTPGPDRNLECDQSRHEPCREEERVAREEVPWSVAGISRRLGRRDGRRIDHDEPGGEQQQRRPRERRVVGEHCPALARRGGQRVEPWQGREQAIPRHAQLPGRELRSRP